MTQLRDLITAHPGLCERLAGICGAAPEEGGCAAEEGEVDLQLLDAVMKRIWPFVGLYTLRTADSVDSTPVCYIDDEFGSGIAHSDTPNVQSSLYLHRPPGAGLDATIPYTIVWTDAGPNQVAVAQGDQLCRDAFAHHTEREHRQWLFSEPPCDAYNDVAASRKAATAAVAERWRELLVDARSQQRLPADVSSVEGLPLKVFTDVKLVNQLLERPEFVCVEHLEEADICWFHGAVDATTRSGLQYEGATVPPGAIVNQFGYEEALVSKDGLARLITERIGQPMWAPVSYRLQQGELADFIADYLARQAAGSDNIWIVKPARLAESVGIVVTTTLQQVLKIAETREPLVVQKYVANPVLFYDRHGNGYKFHLRVTVALSSVEPLKLFMHKCWYARVAGSPYTEDEASLTDFSRQFTSQDRGEHMHMESTQVRWDPELREFEQAPDGVVGTRRVHRSEVIPVIQAKYGPELGFDCDVFEKQMQSMIYEVFLAFATQHPEAHADGKSAAMYAADVMIHPDGTPAMLEVQFGPNFEHQAKLAPGFIDDLFALLFLGENANGSWVQISP